MKKLSLLFIMFFSLAYLANAQVNNHALGVRLGGNGDINGAEISYQHGLSGSNRMEVDLGFGSSSNHTRLFVVSIYHWNWSISNGFNWYVGPGAGLGFYSYDSEDFYFNVALGGQIGLEFDFNSMGFPLLISLDARPMWDFIGNNSGLGWGAAFGVRYTW